MGRKCIRIISARPLFSQGLKLIIEEALPGAIVTTTTDELTINSALEFSGDITVIVDWPNVRTIDLERFFERGDYPTKIMVIGWDDDEIACYSRHAVDNASVRCLIELISEKSPE